MELSPNCLGHIWVFADLGQAEMEALAGRAERRRFAAGQRIFSQGQAANQMFLIKGGRVKLSKVSEDGQEVTLDIRQAGDFLGEGMLNEQEEFPVSATCLEETVTCGFTKQGFEDLVLAHPKLGLRVIKNLSKRIDWLTSRVGSMSHSNLEERLYRVLANVAREHGRLGRRGLELPFPFTHEDLAFLVGAHRVSITRALKELRRAGLVLQEGRTLIVAPEERG
jgi:CRP/FNR family transcriptional regulator